MGLTSPRLLWYGDDAAPTEQVTTRGHCQIKGSSLLDKYFVPAQHFSAGTTAPHVHVHSAGAVLIWDPFLYHNHTTCQRLLLL